MAPGAAPDEALVLTTHSRIITVRHAGTERRVTLAGRMQLAGGAPVAGDRVRLERSARGEWRLAEILPRASRYARAAADGRGAQVLAANADLAVVVLAPQPGLEFLWAERLLAAAALGGMRALLVINKADLLDEKEDLLDRPEYLRRHGIDWLLVSATEGRGLDELRARLRGAVAALAGHSGVGKSTLVNRLIPGAGAKTGGLNRLGYGHHVTSAAQYLEGDGFALIDLAGLREFPLGPLLDEPALPSLFPELAAAAATCRFRDCRHDREPGCAVAGLLPSIDERRATLYEQLKAEAREAAALKKG